MDALITAPDLASYDRIAIAFSGGKDSIACLLHLFDLGVSPSRIELHHHAVDGGGPSFMDWPITTAYCQAIADEFAVPLYLSFRQGGFAGEMDRDQSPTGAISFMIGDGAWRTVGGKGPLGTRQRFPQVSADLRTRWCSSSLKIDVMDAVIRNDERFLGSRTLVVTGERAQESPARARYVTFGPHRTDQRRGARRRRLVDHWRPVHSWSEACVWDRLESWRIVPHPAYQLGWGRLSCRACIFGSPNQWASLRAVYPEAFQRIANRERQCGSTIQRHCAIGDLADRGMPYPAALSNSELAALANRKRWTRPVRARPGAWHLPAGAFGEACGPT